METLQNIFQAEITQRIGWTLLHFVWQAAVIGIVLAIALRMLRRSSANVRYVISCMAMGLAVLMPVITIGMIDIGIETVAPVTRTAIELPAVDVEPVMIVEMPDMELPVEAAVMPSVPLKDRFIAAVEPVLPYAVLGWLFGVFGLSLWHLGGWKQLQRLRRQMVKDVAPALKAKLVQLSSALGIAKTVDLVESALVQVPTVVGHLKPVILLPASALTGLSSEQIEAILAHELAHIKRHDYLVNMLQTVVEILGFYHPAVWLISHKIRVERENCCDDIAVSLCSDKVCYAKALTTMEEIRASHPALAVAASGGNLFERIRRLLGKDTASENKISWLPSVIVIMLICSMLLPMSLAMGKGRKAKTALTKKITLPYSVWMADIDSDDEMKILDFASGQINVLSGFEKEGDFFNKVNSMPQGDIFVSYNDNANKPMISFFKSAGLGGEPPSNEYQMLSPIPMKIPWTTTVTTQQDCKYKFTLTSFDENECKIEYRPMNRTAKKAMAKANSKRPVFVIKGTVTDAETGQPIAGAIVGDTKKYNSGKQSTVTDSRGKYEYKTWHEEHNIKAEAQGYKTMHKGLYTKFFGTEKEKVIDFKLISESDNSVRVYSVNRVVIDFPEEENLTTPEAAYVTARRIIASGERYRWPQISIERPDGNLDDLDESDNTNTPPELRDWWLNTVVLEVMINGNRAAVIAQTPSTLQGENVSERIDYREFKFENGKWLYTFQGGRFENLSEARETAATAKLPGMMDAMMMGGGGGGTGGGGMGGGMMMGQPAKKDGPQILIESRFIVVPEGFFEDINKDIIYTKASNGMLDAKQVDLLIRAIEAHKDSKTLTAPKVMVLDNESANISVLTETAYTSGYTEVESTPDKPEPNVKYSNDGITLDLKPHISDKGLVQLEFEANISDVYLGKELLYKGKHPYHEPEKSNTVITTNVLMNSGKTFLSGPTPFTKYDKDGKTIKQSLLILLKPTIIKEPTKPTKSSTAVRMKVAEKSEADAIVAAENFYSFGDAMVASQRFELMLSITSKRMTNLRIAYQKRDWLTVDENAKQVHDVFRKLVAAIGVNEQTALQAKYLAIDGHKITKEQMELVDLFDMKMLLSAISQNETGQSFYYQLISDIADFSDELHDAIRDKEMSAAPEHYNRLNQKWDLFTGTQGINAFLVSAYTVRPTCLAPGDMVEISVYELLKEGEMAVLKRQVSSNGMISLPDCGPIKVAGKDQDQLRETVKRLYKNVLNNPSVSVIIPKNISSGSRYKSRLIDYAAITIKEGYGFDDIVVGVSSKEYVISKLGKPDEEKNDSKTNGRWVSYRKQYGLDFWINSKNMLGEIRLNNGFKGQLASGVSMKSSQEEVFNAYGRPRERMDVKDLHKSFGNRVLYSKGSICKIHYEERGLLFWFNDTKINQIVISQEVGRKQVLIDMHHISVTENFLKEMGVTINTSENGEVREVRIDRKDDSNSSCSLFTDQEVELIFKAAKQSDKARKLASPKMLLNDGELGTIKSTSDVHFVTGYTESKKKNMPPEPKIEAFMKGYYIEVLPKIIDDGNNIKLNLKTDIYDVSKGKMIGLYEGKYSHSMPSTSHTNIKTEIVIPDQKTAILGFVPIQPADNNDEFEKRYGIILVKPTILRPDVKVD